jgi:multidrug efflux pump subunit AcrA (membrane-fusion protein)
VQVGATARLSIDSGAETWRARVARIAPSANQQTRTFSLFLDVDNREQSQPVLPGMFVRATIDGPRYENVLLAPRGVIERDQVFVFENGQARRRVVTVAAHLLDRAIVSGLPAGSLLITTHLDSLADGTAVEVRPVELPLSGDLSPEHNVADSSARPPVGS